ncbi:hypothetical protein AV530_016726 [Patagioenas fasciata monilis]|uniref:Uncharacterized protein n=1 Tax=Patagioenas fasciata monilis TaxID=372326 RepID=A0A1V4J3D4_PATFA|nr:hypothetical protein AV530_016726 [Patagioenas fasciata monilis]
MKVVLHMGFFLLVQQNPKTEKQDCLTERTMLREDTARENNLTFNSVDSVQPLLEERGSFLFVLPASPEGQLCRQGSSSTAQRESSPGGGPPCRKKLSMNKTPQSVRVTFPLGTPTEQKCWKRHLLCLLGLQYPCLLPRPVNSMEESGSGILEATPRGREQSSFKTTMRFSHFCSIYKIRLLSRQEQ